MPLAPAAPVIPAGAITVGLILLAFAWIALYGLKYGYAYSLGALLHKLADSTRGIRWIGGKIASVFDDIDSFITARIADGIEEVELSAARLWDGLAWLVRETGDALYEFGGDVHDAIYGVVHGEIPAQVGARTGPLTDALSRANRQADARARAEALARTRGIDQLTRDLTAERLARERGIDYVGGLLTTLVLPRIRALDQALSDVIGFTRRNLRIRVGNLERALAFSAVGAAALTMLGRAFPYWQCTNVGRFNRALCRLPVGFLGDLAALAGAAVLLSDICRLADMIREGAEAIQPGLLALVSAADAATRCTTFGPAPELPLERAALPAPEAGLAL